MNIYEKMSAITSELQTVKKNLNIVTGKSSYKAVSERDVLDAVKPLEEKHRVYSYPFSRKILESDILENERLVQGKVVKTNSLYLRVEVVYRFVNIDEPKEYIDITAYGDGIDTGDKATGKGMTYADKYALMKAYKISTGDDPDQEASPEEGYVKAKQEQLDIIAKHYTPDRIVAMLKAYGVSDLADLSLKQASEACKRAKQEVEAQKVLDELNQK